MSDSSLTVNVGQRDMTFVVDANTLVEAVGAGHRTREAREAGAAGLKFSTLVSVGSPVLVTYSEANGKNRALNVRPIASAGADGGSASESKLATGKVKSITGSTLIVTSGGGDLTFALGPDTKVQATGAGKATKAAGGRIAITELVGSGDTVSVSYSDVGGRMSASNVRITIKAR